MGKPNYRQRFTDEEFAVICCEGATDEEIEAKVRSPRYWTYILRHPNGRVASYGRGRSRQTCERNAGRLAVERAQDDFWTDEPWPLGRWRFVLWPPHVRIAPT